jgi:hypothetical protein
VKEKLGVKRDFTDNGSCDLENTMEVSQKLGWVVDGVRLINVPIHIGMPFLRRKHDHDFFMMPDTQRWTARWDLSLLSVRLIVTMTLWREEIKILWRKVEKILVTSNMYHLHYQKSWRSQKSEKSIRTVPIIILKVCTMGAATSNKQSWDAFNALLQLMRKSDHSLLFTVNEEANKSPN